MLYAAAVFLYGICETVFGNSATIYLQGERRIPLGSAELALTAFWAMVTIGRIVVAILSARNDARVIYATLPALAEREFFQTTAAVSGGLVAAYMTGYGVAAFGVGPLRDTVHAALSAVYIGAAMVAAALAGTAFLLVWRRREPA